MADSIITEVLFEELSDAEYALCQFPKQALNAPPSPSGDFRSTYAASSITGAGFKITPLGMPIPDKPDERFQHGRIAGYRVEVNVPACMNGHNRFLVNGVATGARIAVRLLRIWLAQNDCTAEGLSHIKGASAVLCSVTLTFLYEYFTEEKAREALADFRTHSEAVLNPAKPKEGSKPRAYSYPPKPLSGKTKYTYTSYIRMREFLISAYVKERDQDNAFLLPIQIEEIEEKIQTNSERTLRIEITVHGKWLKDENLSSIVAWADNPTAYEKVFALLRSTLRFDEEMRTRRLKKSTIDGLKLSPREKGYLLHHINGMYLQDEHPDSVEMDRRKWTQTYSAARKNIMKATNGIDLNIPYADQLHRLKPALADKLKFQGEYRPPAEWAEHVFSRQSVPKLNALLDRYEELVLTDPKNLPSGPVRDVWLEDSRIKASPAHQTATPAPPSPVRRTKGIGTVQVIRFDDDDSDPYLSEDY